MIKIKKEIGKTDRTERDLSASVSESGERGRVIAVRRKIMEHHGQRWSYS